MQIVEIIWSDSDIEHIATHGVRPEEVEEVLRADEVVHDASPPETWTPSPDTFTSVTGGSDVPTRKTAKKRLRLPAFRTDEQERRFWQTHDPGDYLDQMRPAQVTVSRPFQQRVKERKQNLTLRMEPSRVRELKAVADERGIPYQTLMRMWIVERLRQEQAG